MDLKDSFTCIVDGATALSEIRARRILTSSSSIVFPSDECVPRYLFVASLLAKSFRLVFKFKLLSSVKVREIP
jgi:hypothetical protein